MITAQRWGHGHTAILVSAVGFGVGTALSVAALHGLRPADLLAVELGGSTIVLLTAATATNRLHVRGAARALVQGAVAPGASFLLGDLGLARTTATSGALLLGTDAILTVGLAVAVLACGLVGLVTFNLGIAVVPASRAALLASVEPVAGAVIALVVLGEPLRPVQAVGGALIVSGLIVLTRDRPTPAATPAREPDRDARPPDCVDPECTDAAA